MNKKVRVRFAPSPTGPLHIGGVRTALYNYLFAKKFGGQMILRIEDTDRTRFVEGAEEYIIKSLSWAGIQFDEGVHIGGQFAPYKQSERTSIYKEYVAQLIKNKYAYYAFDTPEELETLRNEFQSKKINFQYDSTTRKSLKNSLTLSKEDVNSLLTSGNPYVVRFLIPENEIVVVHDLIRGEVSINTSQLDDKVLFKSDGLPTYHLANVVDDHLMEITHVIRGEEWLPSAPLHVLLYRSFGWENSMPFFEHLPLLLKPEGNGKLSKRDGDRLGFPVFPMQWTDPKTKEVSSGYRESGYFPEAFINMLAFLGWNPGTEQEIFSMAELINAFSIERINKAGAKFDPEKARWFNQQYLRKKDPEFLVNAFNDILKEKNIVADTESVTAVVSLVKDRVSFIKEMWNEAYFFFVRPDTIDGQTIKKRCKENTPEILEKLSAFIEQMICWETSAISKAIHDFMEQNAYNAGQLMIPLRLALVGALKGPEIFDIMFLIGKDECVERIKIGRKYIALTLTQ